MFDTSLLNNEINAIINSGPKVSCLSPVIDFRIDGTNVRIPYLKVIYYDCMMDFESNYSDDIIVKFMITAGDYQRYINSNKDRITADVSFDNYIENTTNKDNNFSVGKKSYRVVFMDRGDIELSDPTGSNIDYNKLDMHMVEMTCQLLPSDFESVRFKQVGGVLRQTNVENMIKVLMGPSKDTPLIRGVDMVPPNTNIVRTHIEIPQSTKLINLPTLAQKKLGGVYSAGISSYIRDGIWYIWPIYDVSRFSRSKKQITIINVPASRYPNIERTYRVAGNRLSIICTGEIDVTDITEVLVQNKGNGVRFANANAAMDGFTQTENNKTVAVRPSNNTEVVSEVRRDNRYIAPVLETGFTDNQMMEFSKLAARRGKLIQLVWQNSLPELIPPNSVVRLMYQSGSGIKTLEGTILKMHVYRSQEGVGMLANKFSTQTAMVLFVDKTGA